MAKPGRGIYLTYKFYKIFSEYRKVKDSQNIDELQKFWTYFREELEGLGPAFINDDVWLTLFSLGGNFYPGYGVTLNLYQTNTSVTPLSIDQLGATRPLNALADIGAIEIPWAMAGVQKTEFHARKAPDEMPGFSFPD